MLRRTADVSAVSSSRHYLLSDTADIACCVAQQTLCAVSDSRRFLLCETADVVGCVKQQTLSAVSHSRQCLLCDAEDIVCCVKQQTLCAMPHSGHVCCFTQHTCLPFDAADIFAISFITFVPCVTQLNPIKNVIMFFQASVNSQAPDAEQSKTKPIAKKQSLRAQHF